MRKIDFSDLSRWWTPLPPPSAGRGNLLDVGKNDPMFRDRFKSLRAKFEYKADLLKYRLVGVTSSIAGEGKTLTCAHLATSLALTGRHNVLMVDTDIRKADLTRGMSLPRHPGLTEHLLGAATLSQIVRNSHHPALQVIAAGAEVNSPADLLSGDPFMHFLKTIRERYDVVLLDTPPILAVADTLAIREQLDGFLFLFRISYTPMSMFRRALEEVGEKKILGVVINGEEGESNAYYQKYYGSYYMGKSRSSESGTSQAGEPGKE